MFFGQLFVVALAQQQRTISAASVMALFGGDKMIDSLTAAFQRDSTIATTSASGGGDVMVSFKDKGLKLNNEDDAAPICRAIDESSGMTALELSGNTVGIDAGLAIAESLKRQPKLKRCIWNDMFRTRLRSEIPKTLRSLCDAMMAANVHLVELDLADNAFSQTGAEAIEHFLRSDSAYSLEILNLNNQGLGSGGENIAKALIDCHASSSAKGRPLRLKTLIIGRNRLENLCAIALAEAFRLLGSLEEVAMPQNGIQHEGVTALCSSFAYNPNLRIINLQDNTFTQKGAKRMAKVLPKLQKLEELNLADCLCRSSGALEILDALKNGHAALKELNLSGNELGPPVARKIIEVMSAKKSFTTLGLSVNCYGSEFDSMKQLANNSKIGQINIGEESDDGGSEEDEEAAEDSDDEASVESRPEVHTDADRKSSPQKFTVATNGHRAAAASSQIGVENKFELFVTDPTWENLKQLGSKPEEVLVCGLKDQWDNPEAIAKVIIKICESFPPYERPAAEVLSLASRCTGLLLTEVNKHRYGPLQPTSQIFNCIMAYLGLVKTEVGHVARPNTVTNVLLLLTELLRNGHFKNCRQVLQFYLNHSSSTLLKANAPAVNELLSVL